LRTEKGTGFLPLNKYLFLVDKSANKLQIKKAVEEIYKVGVTSVNTMRQKGKPKRIRYHLGYTKLWKKAIVTLKEGDSIEIASS
jgi:large subunit ribosomal protein L23